MVRLLGNGRLQWLRHRRWDERRVGHARPAPDRMHLRFGPVKRVRSGGDGAHWRRDGASKNRGRRQAERHELGIGWRLRNGRTRVGRGGLSTEDVREFGEALAGEVEVMRRDHRVVQLPPRALVGLRLESLVREAKLAARLLLEQATTPLLLRRLLLPLLLQLTLLLLRLGLCLCLTP